MKKLTVCAILATLLCAPAAKPQSITMPHPPEGQGPMGAVFTPDAALTPRRIDLVRLQQEADDLARTAQSIPSDVASVRRGMLPKDVLQKLKQIEKLSKRLRNELNP